MLPEISYLLGQWTVEYNRDKGWSLPKSQTSENMGMTHILFMLSSVTIALVGVLLLVAVPWPLFSLPQLWCLLVAVTGSYMVVTAWRCRPGTFWPLWAVCLVAGFLVFMVLKSLFDPVVPGLPDWLDVPGASLPVACLLSLALSIALAVWDAVPLNSRLARLAYAGRIHHLRGLLALAERYGWAANGPGFPRRALRVMGDWSGRHVYIESGEEAQVIQGRLQRYYLAVQTFSEYQLWPVVARPTKPTGAMRGSRELNVRLWAPEGEKVDASDLEGVRGAYAATDLHRQGGQVFTRAHSIAYVVHAFTTMPTSEDVEKALAGLNALVTVIEDRNLCYESEDGGNDGQ